MRDSAQHHVYHISQTSCFSSIKQEKDVLAPRKSGGNTVCLQYFDQDLCSRLRPRHVWVPLRRCKCFRARYEHADERCYQAVGIIFLCLGFYCKMFVVNGEEACAFLASKSSIIYKSKYSMTHGFVFLLDIFLFRWRFMDAGISKGSSLTYP